MSWIAFGDESIPFGDDRRPVAYLVSEAIADPAGLEDSREAMASLDVGGQRLHFSHETAARKITACRVLAEMEALHVVVAGAPVQRQERTRAVCLERLFLLLDDAGVQNIVMDSRGRPDDARDVRTLRNTRARRLLPASSPLHIEFDKPATEAALVAADIAAGAVGAAMKGNPEFLQFIGHMVEIHEVEL